MKKLNSISFARLLFNNFAVNSRRTDVISRLSRKWIQRSWGELRNSKISHLTEKLEKLEKNGVVVFSISELTNGLQLMSDIKRSYEHIQGGPYSEIKGGKKTYLTKFYPRCAKEQPEWRLAMHPEVLFLINSYVSFARPTIRELYYLKNQKTTYPVESQLWHRDGGGTCLKLFLYLNNVESDNGPFYYLEGSHEGNARKILSREATSNRYEDIEINRIFSEQFTSNIVRINECVGEEGTLIIANTAGFHKGGFVTENERLILMGAYYLPWYDREPRGPILEEANY